MCSNTSRCTAHVLTVRYTDDLQLFYGLQEREMLEVVVTGVGDLSRAPTIHSTSSATRDGMS